MAFDPKKKYADSFPAGTFLLAMVNFKRREGTSNGKPYKMRSCGFQVVHGPMKKRMFFDTLGMDESNDQAMARVARLCGAIEQVETFDLQDDAAFGAVFLGRPFKATVKTETKGQYTNTSIVKIEDMTRAESDACDAWWDDWCQRADQRGDASGADTSFDHGANKDGWDE
jgi:hypothetical protein